ncbi:MAG: hypothetical protein EOO62_04030 [Hymenobacter sp.]|nr:MAG: hypothetical protein EOO62_04030 [Hymenobacter sp.]
MTIDWEPAPQITLSVADTDNPYDVTTSAVAAAATIEKLLVAYEARLIDPPMASIYCVCPTYYPDLWADLAE